MLKTMIKEVIIILLLIIAVLLVLGIIFYDYLPNMKVIPSVAKYSTSESVKNDLNETVKNENETYATFTITAGDLNNYAKTNSYVARNDNPFSSYKQTSAGSSGNTINGSNTNVNGNGSMNSNQAKVVNSTK